MTIVRQKPIEHKKCYVKNLKDKTFLSFHTVLIYNITVK